MSYLRLMPVPGWPTGPTPCTGSSGPCRAVDPTVQVARPMPRSAKITAGSIPRGMPKAGDRGLLMERSSALPERGRRDRDPGPWWFQSCLIPESP